MQDEAAPPTVEELERRLGDLADYVEGQQRLLDFLFDMLAGNLREADRARLRQALRSLLLDPDDPATLPVRRVLEAVGTPQPVLRLVPRDE